MSKRRIEHYEDSQLIGVEEIDVAAEADNADEVERRLQAAIAALGQVASGTGTMTTAQLTTAVRLLARAQVALLRHALGRFEAVD